MRKHRILAALTAAALLWGCGGNKGVPEGKRNATDGNRPAPESVPPKSSETTSTQPGQTGLLENPAAGSVPDLTRAVSLAPIQDIRAAMRDLDLVTGRNLPAEKAEAMRGACARLEAQLNGRTDAEEDQRYRLLRQISAVYREIQAAASATGPEPYAGSMNTIQRLLEDIEGTMRGEGVPR